MLTAAVCLQCGARKFGAWTQCDACGHLPSDDTDRARHLLCTDPYVTPDELTRICEVVAGGGDPGLDPDEVAAVERDIAAASPARVAAYALLVGGVPFAAIVGALVLLTWLLVR